MTFNESTVEDAALTWFGELGYEVAHGPHLAPGEPAAGRESFGEVVLVGRLREAIQRLNPEIPEDAREDAMRKVLRLATPSRTVRPGNAGRKGMKSCGDSGNSEKSSNGCETRPAKAEPGRPVASLAPGSSDALGRCVGA
jgi:type I site-specific restriction-modification system R (restriction) subunit